jgi:hypothetical protein
MAHAGQYLISPIRFHEYFFSTAGFRDMSCALPDDIQDSQRILRHSKSS